MLHSVHDTPNDAHESSGAGAAVTGCAVVGAAAEVVGAAAAVVEAAAEVVGAAAEVVGAAAEVVAAAVVGGRMTGQMEHTESLQQLKKPLTALENNLKVPESCTQIAPPPRVNCN